MSTVMLSDAQLVVLADLIAERLNQRAPESELLTAEQVALRLGQSRQHVWAMSRRGEIPTVRIGRGLRFRKQDVDNWITRRTTQRPKGTRS